MALDIEFYGAAGTVTGSNFLVNYDNKKFLVDCGMFQGPDVEYKNLEDFPYDPKDIDFVLLTHAHLDHVGMIPKLFRNGFQGKVYCTYNTAQLAEIILQDSAKIQESNFTQGIPWTFAGKVELVYDARDAERAIHALTVKDFDTEFEPTNGIKVNFKRAGHVLGAASIELEIDNKVIVFSGDIGRSHHQLIQTFSPEKQRDADYLIIESLYGGQYHTPREDSVRELISTVNNTLERGGSAFIPVFAMQRTQEILLDLKMAYEADELTKSAKVWLDSPMAQRVTRVYEQALNTGKGNIFSFPLLKFVKKYRESLKISSRSGQIILAGSGMASGGRIMGHLARNLPNKKNSVVFVGFQAEATTGRELTSGVKTVNINDKPVKVNATIKHLHGFSAHGDTADYLNWVGRYDNPNLKNIFLVHAEPERSQAMKEILKEKGYDTKIPQAGDKYGI